MQGGPDWKEVAQFYKRVYDCNSASESSNRIVSAIRQVPPGHCPVLVAHNGPAGMGTAPQEICAVDFRLDRETGEPTGGDWGDVDLQAAMHSDESRCALLYLAAGERLAGKCGA